MISNFDAWVKKDVRNEVKLWKYACFSLWIIYVLTIAMLLYAAKEFK